MEGLEVARRFLAPNGTAMFANDTLVQNGAFSIGDYIDLVFHSFSRKGRGKLEGFLSRIPKEGCVVEGHPLSFNVCSKFFIAKADLLTPNLIQCAVEEAKNYLQGLPPRRVSQQYHEFLDSWLHGAIAPRWYKAQPRTRMSIEVRYKKSAMIFCEHFLTARAAGSIVEIKRSLLRELLGRLTRVGD
jgi:hypothetical protein